MARVPATALPLFVEWRARTESHMHSDAPHADRASRVRAALDLRSTEFAILQQRVADLAEENWDLRERFRGLDGETSWRRRSDEGAPPTSV